MLDEHCNDIVQQLNWQGPVYRVSAATGSGTETLCQDIMAQLDSWREQEREAERQAKAANADADADADSSTNSSENGSENRTDDSDIERN